MPRFRSDWDWVRQAERGAGIHKDDATTSFYARHKQVGSLLTMARVSSLLLLLRPDAGLPAMLLFPRRTGVTIHVRDSRARPGI